MAATSPGSLRSPRKRALEIGADAGKLEDNDAGYCVSCGIPNPCGGHYEEEKSARPVHSSPMKPAPFKVGG